MLLSLKRILGNRVEDTICSIEIYPARVQSLDTVPNRQEGTLGIASVSDDRACPKYTIVLAKGALKEVRVAH